MNLFHISTRILFHIAQTDEPKRTLTTSNCCEVI